MAFFGANIAADVVPSLEKAYPDIVLRDHPCLGLCEEDKGGGSLVAIPVRSGYTVGIGTTMTGAVASNGQTQRKQFQVTPTNPVYLSSDVNLAQAAWSLDPQHAAVDIVTDEARATMEGMSDVVERLIISGDGYGTIGSIASSTNPSGQHFVLTLKRAQDVYRFVVGRTGVSKATAAAASLDAGTYAIEIVDPGAGTVQVLGDGTWAPTNTHVLGESGVMAASTSVIVPPGWAGWNPDINSRPVLGTDNWFGVDRGSNPQALAGTAIDCSGQSVKQAINTLLTTMAQTGGFKVDTVFLAPPDYQKFSDDLGSAVEFVDVMGEMGMNYTGIRIAAGKGAANVIQDTFTSSGLVRACDSRVLKIKHPGKKPIEMKDENGAGFIAVTTDDIARFTFRANYIFYPTNPAALGNALIY